MPMLTPFHEVRFPTDVALGAHGGPERRTEIISLGSGFEQRNARWADARRRYNAGFGIRTLDALSDVVSFFEERQGSLYGFRYRDPIDWKSCKPSQTQTMMDQTLGYGDGVKIRYEIVKNYGQLPYTYVRKIKKIVAASLMVAVDTSAKIINTHFTADENLGTITFLKNSIPMPGQAITAGYQFDTPVRFDTDYLAVNLSLFEAGDIPSIPIVEVRL